MVKLVAGPGGLDMADAGTYFDAILDATPTLANSAKVEVSSPSGFSATVKGVGFTYDNPDEFPTDGLITSVRGGGAGLTSLSITDMALDVSDMRIWVPQGSPGYAQLANAVFGGADRIYGSRDASNTLSGLGGDDRIAGGAENDRLGGDAGADTLVGGRGRDQMTGGADADAFVFGSTLDSRKASPDIIYQITDADRIDLRAIDANINKDGNQAFEIVDAFSHKASQITLSYDFNTYYTTIQLDVDGDAKSDMTILLDGLVGGFADHSNFTNFVL